MAMTRLTLWTKILHYFGCLRFEDRASFFDTESLHAFWQGEYDKIQKSGVSDAEAKKKVLEKDDSLGDLD